MELSISAAKPRLSALIAAAQRGERVVITKRGVQAVEQVACPQKDERPKGDFFARLKEARKRLGIKPMPPDEAKEFRAALQDSALSRRLLGVDD